MCRSRCSGMKSTGMTAFFGFKKITEYGDAMEVMFKAGVRILLPLPWRGAGAAAFFCFLQSRADRLKMEMERVIQKRSLGWEHI